MKKEPANWIGLLLLLAIVAVIAIVLQAAR